MAWWGCDGDDHGFADARCGQQPTEPVTPFFCGSRFAVELALGEERAAGEHDTLDARNLRENGPDEAGDLVDLSSQPGTRPWRELPGAVEDISPQPPAPGCGCLGRFLCKLCLDTRPALSFLNASAELVAGAPRRQRLEAGALEFNGLHLARSHSDLGGGFDEAEQFRGSGLVEALAKIPADAGAGPPADVPDLGHEPVPVPRGFL